MTFKELTYSVWEILSGYNITDDNELSKKQIEEVMLGMNATLIREAYNNNNITQSLYVMDGPLKVKELTNSVTIDGILIKSQSDLCKVELKPLVQGIGWKDIIYFGGLNYSDVYNRKSFRNIVRGNKGTIWSTGSPIYGMVGNTAYLMKKNLMGASYVIVDGLWRDPREASGYDENVDFPTPSEYKIQMLTIQHMAQGKGIPPDLINDAQRAIQMPEQRKAPEPRKQKQE